jgi:hypothetical protein
MNDEPLGGCNLLLIDAYIYSHALALAITATFKVVGHQWVCEQCRDWKRRTRS